MIIKRIRLKDFQCHGELDEECSALTFIRGRNGSGKTTLGLDAILFCLFGYCKKNLSDLPRKGHSTDCEVEIWLTFKGDQYRILRKYPTSIEIEKNGECLKFSTGTEAGKYLQGLFGDVKEFQRFRMIDNSIGINFLEEGPQTLKKILFSVSDQIFNGMKERLNEVKRQREIYNKEKAVIYTHYPSEARLKALEAKFDEIDIELGEIKKKDNEMSRDEMKQSGEVGKHSGQLKTSEMQLEKIKRTTNCYACGQEIPQSKRNFLAKEKEKEVKELAQKIKEAVSILEEIGEIRGQLRPSLAYWETKSKKVKEWMTKLEGRIKQKDYKYSSRDVEVAKEALKELDSISTRYLVQSVRLLEPIINSVLERAALSAKFEADENGKFAILITKEGIAYGYKDLSSGQRLVLQIAFKLALLLERGEEGLIVADEGMSSLDRDNLLHILSIFENFPFQLVFIIHHFEGIPGGVSVIDLDQKEVEKYASKDS